MHRLVQIVSYGLWLLCLALYFAWVGLVAAWIGERPLSADALHPYAFNCGVEIFLMETDVRLGRRLVLAGAVVLGVAIGAHVLEARMRDGGGRPLARSDADLYARRPRTRRAGGLPETDL